MNVLVFALLSAVCAALGNLCFDRNAKQSKGDNGAKGYLLFYYLFSFLLSICIFPEVLKGNFNFTMIMLGATVGMLNVFLMLLTSRALKRGPAGLTFAFQNVSSVFPAILLFLAFGTKFGFQCTWVQLLGMGLVTAGLFIGAYKSSSGEQSAQKTSKSWLPYALGCLSVQVLALTVMQGRCVLFECGQMEGPLSKFGVSESDDIWFMPSLFAVALIAQALMVLKDRAPIAKYQMAYGSAGGLLNCASTALLLLATMWAQPAEKAVLFPCFAVATLLFCNLWANRLYKEKFNLVSNGTCALGVFVGTLG